MKQQIGEFLATMRKANGYTQQEVADKLGISNKTLSNWECDKVLPDVLLLPALADLYGVTVDEILAGERRAREERILSNKAEKNVLRSKLTRFSAQSWILIGVIIIGLVFCLVGSFFGLNMFGISMIICIIMLSLGIACVIVGLTVFYALWSGTDCDVDENTEIGRKFCILRKRKLSERLCVIALSFFVCWLLFAEWIFFDVTVGTWPWLELNWVRIVLTLLALSVPVTFFAVSKKVHKKALLQWGEENVKNGLSAHGKFCRKIARVGLAPFAVGVLVALVGIFYSYFYDYIVVWNVVGMLIIGVDVVVCCALCIKDQYKCETKF